MVHGFGGEQIFFRLLVSAVGVPLGEVCPDGLPVALYRISLKFQIVLV